MSLLPLESNPDVMNRFLHKLGVSTKWNLVDVYGLDPEALQWVPKPVLALILLFPCSDQFYKHAEEEKKTVGEKGQVVSPKLFYMKQFVSNACGTIALIHCVANNEEKLNLQEGPFKDILNQARDMDPHQRGELLLKAAETPNSEFCNLITAHQELAMEGQTEVNPGAQVNHHFVALVEKDGCLYELDGRKEFPVNHGPTTPETFLEDAAKVCRDFIARDSEDVNFTVMALTAAEN